MEKLDSETLISNSSPLSKRDLHTRALKPVDHLIAKVGIGIVDTVERYYQKYLENPSESTARSYRLWRLRLHRRLKNDKKLLEKINEARNLGLNDERPGETCWELDFGG